MAAPSRTAQYSSETNYGLAFIFTFIALVFALACKPLAKLSSFSLFQAAIFLSAWYGGLRPAIFSCILSIAALDYFFVSPVFDIRFDWLYNGLDFVVFGAVALVTSSLSARIKQAKSDVQEINDILELRIRERTQQLLQANQQLTKEVAERLEAEKALLDVSNREQRRMGQDLHDGLCQNLAGLRLLADVLNEKLTAQKSPEVIFVEKIERRLSEALSQADAVSRGLYPVELETNGLIAALQEMAANFSSMYSVDCRFVSRREILIDDGALATHVFRIAQEAVMNAFKGGKATRIIVRLFAWRDQLRLVVADNGTGFDLKNKRQGMGLKIMEYRARMINAALEIRLRRRGGVLMTCAFKPHAFQEEAVS